MMRSLLLPLQLWFCTHHLVTVPDTMIVSFHPTFPFQSYPRYHFHYHRSQKDQQEKQKQKSSQTARTKTNSCPQKTKQRRTMIPSQINNIKKRKERKLKREQLHGHQTQRTLLGIVLCVASAALRTWSNVSTAWDGHMKSVLEHKQITPPTNVTCVRENRPFALLFLQDWMQEGRIELNI